MRTTHLCPVCGDGRGRRHGAVLAPFIGAWVRPALDRRDLIFRRCACCGLGFFEQRFEPQEMERLYGRYRSRAYLECRRALEPWYSEALNAANLAPAVIAARRSQLDRFLRETLPPGAGLDRVIVDLGGDAGQFIPQDLAAESYLLESSDQHPWPGVTRIASLDALRPCEQLLLICAHVLEHLPEPLAFLAASIQQAERRSTEVVLYLEVPLERVRLGLGTTSGLYRAWLRILQRPWLQPLLILLDALSLMLRSWPGVVVPPLFLKLHEHINLFTESSLRRLVQRLDFEVVTLETLYQSGLISQQGIIRLVAVKTGRAGRVGGTRSG